MTEACFKRFECSERDNCQYAKPHIKGPYDVRRCPTTQRPLFCEDLTSGCEHECSGWCRTGPEHCPDRIVCEDGSVACERAL